MMALQVGNRGKTLRETGSAETRLKRKRFQHLNTQYSCVYVVHETDDNEGMTLLEFYRYIVNELLSNMPADLVHKVFRVPNVRLAVPNQRHCEPYLGDPHLQQFNALQSEMYEQPAASDSYGTSSYTCEGTLFLDESIATEVIFSKASDVDMNFDSERRWSSSSPRTSLTTQKARSNL